MITKKEAEIELSDFESLVSNKVPETRQIEYKRELKFASDGERKEFLADISAFANTQGGQIIFGIEDDDGVPINVEGIQIDNPDKLLQTLEGIIREGLDPRITGIEIWHPVHVAEDRYILLINIPRSWNLPHRVSFKGSNKFHGRNANGKYQLDVSELRQAFTLSEALTEKVQNFREERILKIINGNAPIVNNWKQKVVVHLIPYDSFQPGKKIDFDQLKKDKTLLKPMKSHSWNYKFNFDGYMSFFDAGNENVAYNQYFHNGIIEIVSGEIVYETAGHHVMYGESFLVHLFDAVDYALRVMFKLDTNYPIFVCLSLLDFDDVILGWKSGQIRLNALHKFDRDYLNYPPSLVESRPDEVRDMFESIMTSIWHSAGYEYCPLYHLKQ